MSRACWGDLQLRLGMRQFFSSTYSSSLSCSPDHRKHCNHHHRRCHHLLFTIHLHQHHDMIQPTSSSSFGVPPPPFPDSGRFPQAPALRPGPHPPRHCPGGPDRPMQRQLRLQHGRRSGLHHPPDPQYVGKQTAGVADDWLELFCCAGLVWSPTLPWFRLTFRVCHLSRESRCRASKPRMINATHEAPEAIFVCLLVCVCVCLIDSSLFRGCPAGTAPRSPCSLSLTPGLPPRFPFLSRSTANNITVQQPWFTYRRTGSVAVSGVVCVVCRRHSGNRSRNCQSDQADNTRHLLGGRS